MTAKITCSYATINFWRKEVAFAGFGVSLMDREDECRYAGLLKPYKVLLARADLLKFLKNKCEERGASIIYATHTFDWPSHIVYVARGELQLALPMEEVKEESKLSLIRTVEKWLRKERDEDRKMWSERKAKGLPEFEREVNGSCVIGDPARCGAYTINNGWAAGRLNSTIVGGDNFILSSNRVLR
ncbi:ABC transporter I family member 20-like [Impatiens glandulifera]|uniref:ABC transporter I family member 20-like n=1 Tax=Impatiens glandulifera TaxID=253017 RepID=UPI001FB0C4C8|nr:ABC transporter I family member 20-like [Impatiens glandulifera]